MIALLFDSPSPDIHISFLPSGIFIWSVCWYFSAPPPVLQFWNRFHRRKLGESRLSQVLEPEKGKEISKGENKDCYRFSIVAKVGRKQN